MKLYAVKFSGKVTDELYHTTKQLISPKKQERLKRFYFWEDSYRTLMGDILVRYNICRDLKIDNNDIEFEKNKYGKPYLKNHDNYYFNISHSGDWVVCAIDDEEIGIDVEKIKDIDLAIAQRYFSPKEYANLQEQPESNKYSYFFDLWSLKESYIKAAGMGLSLSLSSFSVLISDDGIELDTENDFSNCYFKQYDIDCGYKFSVCAQKENFPEEVVIMDIHQLFNEFGQIVHL